MKRRVSFWLAALMCVALLAAGSVRVQAAKVDTTALTAEVGVPSANVYTARTTADLNLRKSAKDGDVITTIPKGRVVSILNRGSDGWYQVTYEKDTGYCSAQYLTDNTDIMYTTQKLNLRSSKDSDSKSNIITAIPGGGKVEVIGRIKDTDWAKVNYRGKVGYCIKTYLVKSVNDPATIDLKNVKFEDKTVYYDGKYHSMPEVKGLPANVKVVYSTTVRQKKIGTYTVKATFKAARSKDKLINASSRKAALTITVKKKAVYYTNKLKVRVLDNNIKGKGTVRVIGHKNKSSLKSLQIPDTVKIGGTSFDVVEVGSRSFSKCKKLKEVRIGNNVTAIYKAAFAFCPKLESVRIGTSLKKLGKSVFRDDTKLKKVYIRSKKLTTVGASAFMHMDKTGFIKVPESKLEEYQALLKGKGQGNVAILPGAASK